MNQMADWLMYFDEIGSRVEVDETELMGYYDLVLSSIWRRSKANTKRRRSHRSLRLCRSSLD
jgi:hypothetical protein